MPARGRQGHLFGEPEPAKPTEPHVEPAPVDEDLARIAALVPGSVRFGTSSWSFPGWRGIVWGNTAALSSTTLSRAGLAAYSRHPFLRAVGVDRTYYAPVEPDVLRHYARAVPEDFRFVVKMPAAVTAPVHLGAKGRDRERNPAWLDPAVAERISVAPFVEGLGDRAGALVAQLPPLGRYGREPARFAERLGRFLDGLPRGPAYAVEIRDRSLLGSSYGAALRDAGATHCVSVHPRMPTVEEQLEYARQDSMLVVRWMLHPTLSYEAARERYAPFDRLVDEDESTRAALVEAIVAWLDRGRDVIVIANNKAEGSAPLSLFRLGSRLARRLERDRTGRATPNDGGRSRSRRSP